jgi:heat shock protein HtpX|tara:strand:+ start:208 stop:1065 length:858 start_codon:yes stop_codon:yes gene_type:complete
MAIQNQLKTVVLLASMTGLLLWIGSYWGASGLTIAIIFSLGMNVVSYWFSDKIALRMYHAKLASESEYSTLHSLVAECARLANIPKPRVYVIDTPQANAFATGPTPKRAAVACTTGIMDALSEDELKGVIAHEVAHITNYDTLTSTVAATIAGVISYVAFMARWAAMFGGFGGRDRDGNGLELLVLAILTPVLATIIQLAISRSREFQADASAAKSLHTGEGLASALLKLESNIKHHPFRATSGTQTTAHLFISNPFGKMHGLIKLFSTHPPTAERVKKLRSGRF